MKTGHFRLIEHTADIGLEIHAPDRETVFATAGKGLFSIITDLEAIEPEETVEFEIDYVSDEDALIDFLNELIYLNDAKKMLFKEFDIEIRDSKLKVRAHGERIDPNRHTINEQVKSATYHELEFRSEGEGYTAKVIFDV